MSYSGKSKYLISSGYVYYDRLNSEQGRKWYPRLYDYISCKLGDIDESFERKKRDSAQVWGLAQTEAYKEVALLSEHFGINLDIDLNNPESAKQLIEAYNDVIGLKAIYDRNIKNIKANKKARPIYSYFGHYFINTLETELQNFTNSDKILFHFTNWVVDRESQEAIDEWYERNKASIVRKAVKAMFNGEADLQDGVFYTNEELNAYRNLTNYLGSKKDSNSIISQIYSGFRLDEISSILLDKLRASRNSTVVRVEQATKDAMIKKMGKLDQKNNIMESITRTLISMSNKSGSVNTNNINITPTNIMTFGVNVEQIQQELDQAALEDKSMLTMLIEDLGTKINNVKNGFIVYESSQNFAPSVDKKYQELTASDYIDTVLSKLNLPQKELSGALLQLGKGAIGDYMDVEHNISAIIAQSAAYFLFDDFETIGETSNNSIHVFSFGGTVITLGYLLSLYARAIDSFSEGGADHLTSYIKVNITSPEIIYKNDRKIFPERWDIQSEYAKANTKIEIYLLRSFQSIVAKYL